MIVFRQMLRVKPGCMEKDVELAKKAKEYQKELGINSRLYISNIAPWNSVAVELEFKDLADLGEFQGKWYQIPEVIEGLKEASSTH